MVFIQLINRLPQMNKIERLNRKLNIGIEKVHNNHKTINVHIEVNTHHAQVGSASSSSSSRGWILLCSKMCKDGFYVY